MGPCTASAFYRWMTVLTFPHQRSFDDRESVSWYIGVNGRCLFLLVWFIWSDLHLWWTVLYCMHIVWLIYCVSLWSAYCWRNEGWFVRFWFIEWKEQRNINVWCACMWVCACMRASVCASTKIILVVGVLGEACWSIDPGRLHTTYVIVHNAVL